MKIFLAVCLAVLAAVIGAALIALPVMWVVNYLFTPSFLVAVFGVPQIGFGQAAALAALCSALFNTSVSTKGN